MVSSSLFHPAQRVEHSRDHSANQRKDTQIDFFNYWMGDVEIRPVVGRCGNHDSWRWVFSVARCLLWFLVEELVGRRIGPEAFQRRLRRQYDRVKQEVVP